MTQEIKVPSLGESISEAVISELLVQSGQNVTQDQEILEIETEKVNQVLYAPEAGVITLNVNAGDTVKIGQVIGSVEASKEGATPQKETLPKQEESPKQEGASKDEKEAPKPAKQEPSSKKQEVQSSSEKKEEETPKEGEPAVFEEIRQSPEAFVEELRAPQKAPQEPSKSNTNVRNKNSQGERRERMPKIRQTIARRLVEAKQSMALLTTFNEVDMSSVMELRKKHKESFEKKHGVRLGFMSFFIKAACSALQKFPKVNARIEGDEFVYNSSCDINVAISSERGLVVPLLEACENKSFADIEKKIVELAKKAQENKMSMDEMKAGGFTISNGGVFGSTFSTPIVNPPQSAILGMHRISERPYVVDGKIVVRPIMILALSYDHRIIDGQEAVSFLAQIVKVIEDPATLLIDL